MKFAFNTGHIDIKRDDMSVAIEPVSITFDADPAEMIELYKAMPEYVKALAEALNKLSQLDKTQ